MRRVHDCDAFTSMPVTIGRGLLRRDGSSRSRSVNKLVLGHMDDYDADLELGEILPAFQAAVDCNEHAEFLLGELRNGPSFQ